MHMFKRTLGTNYVLAAWALSVYHVRIMCISCVHRVRYMNCNVCVSYVYRAFYVRSICASCVYHLGNLLILYTHHVLILCLSSTWSGTWYIYIYIYINIYYILGVFKPIGNRYVGQLTIRNFTVSYSDIMQAIQYLKAYRMDLCKQCPTANHHRVSKRHPQAIAILFFVQHFGVSFLLLHFVILLA